jgi:uncharacterized membrane protein
MARKPTRRPRPPKPTLLQRLRTDFLTGLVVVLPMFLTIYLVWATIHFVDARIVPLIPGRYNPENVFGRNIFGLGVLVFLSFTTLAGALAKGFIGRQILLFGERLVERTPVVRSVYNGLKQIVETIFNQSGTTFQKACLIEYPRRGLWAVAFVATDTRGEIPGKAGEPDLVSVFLPTTPNPTSGFLLFVPRRDMIPLDMSLEEAAKLIISAGLVTPPAAAPPGTRTVAKLVT